MEQFLKDILLAFIPVFVAVDAVGTLPVFVSLTEDLAPPERRSVILQSMITAYCVALGFIFLGNILFRFLGITIGDFMVAGGAILFSIAIIDIVSPVKRQRAPGDAPGAVPLGTPLIAGPALLTTSLLMIGQYGIVPTIISVTANIVIAGAVFLSSAFLTRLFGEAGSKALSKIISLFLAAIAVMLIRKGILLMTAAS
jgi:multiple antibiotic resistance protein